MAVDDATGTVVQTTEDTRECLVSLEGLIRRWGLKRCHRSFPNSEIPKDDLPEVVLDMRDN